MQRLSGMVQADLITVLLPPAFDIASMDEDKSTWKTVDED